MGGFGSGRQGWRSTVEECRVLDVNRWAQEGLLKPGSWRAGSWIWRYPDSDEITASINYQVDTISPSAPRGRLRYRITDTGEQLDYEVLFTTTRPYLGGTRWWFVCPLSRNGVPCGRRVGKLYLPPGGRYFGCRICYNLTYTSCLESHKFDRLYARMAQGIPNATPAMVKWAISRMLRQS